MLTDPTNSRKRHIFQATSWLNYVYSSMRKVHVLTVLDANIFTQSTISRPNWLTPKHWRKVLDLPTLETNRSVVKVSVLTACGPISRPQTDVELQRSQDFQSSSKFTTRKSTMLRSTRTSWRDLTLQAQWATAALKSSTISHSRLTNLNHSRPTNHSNSKWTTIITTTTLVITIWATTWNTCRITLNTKTTNIKTKCIIIIINIINNRTITRATTHADSRPTHLPILWTRTSNRSGPDNRYL